MDTVESSWKHSSLSLCADRTAVPFPSLTTSGQEDSRDCHITVSEAEGRAPNRDSIFNFFPNQFPPSPCFLKIVKKIIVSQGTTQNKTLNVQP